MNLQTQTRTAAPAQVVTCDPHATLRALVAEQAMRFSTDATSGAAFSGDGPGTRSAQRDVGRFLAEHPRAMLVAGSPMTVWAGGGELNPAWRAAHPASPGSAYAHLEFLAQLYPNVEVGERNPFDVLCDLQARAAAEFTS